MNIDAEKLADALKRVGGAVYGNCCEAAVTAPSERERFERHVKAYTGRDMAYHERNGTTGLEFGWTCWQAARAQPTPPAVVEPLTDGLLQQHNRDSQELRRLCAARDQARSERDALKAEIAGLEASCSMLGRLVDELRPDAERLEWVLRRCAGSWLRSYLGVVSDTSDMDTLRTLIDANRGALIAHGIGIKKGAQDGTL